MSGHTPGPWVVKFRADGSAYISMGNHRVGQHKQFDLMLEAGRDNDEDDARLIAAAPDLLNALAVLADAAESRGIPCDAARAAIAKATQP